MKKVKMTDNDITYQIRGAIFDVYNTLGPGLLEDVYEEALSYEITQRGLQTYRQVQVPVCYKGVILKSPLKMDIVVENRIVVELKSVEEMKRVFWKQTLTYLKLTGMHVGLLVNFTTDNIKESIYRIIN